jgi:hypothetical protein
MSRINTCTSPGRDARVCARTLIKKKRKKEKERKKKKKKVYEDRRREIVSPNKRILALRDVDA